MVGQATSHDIEAVVGTGPEIREAVAVRAVRHLHKGSTALGSGAHLHKEKKVVRVGNHYGK